MRLPVTLGFAVVGAAAVIACRHESTPPDAKIVRDAAAAVDAPCQVYCIPDGSDAGVCPSPAVCADGMGHCPAGCEPEPIV